MLTITWELIHFHLCRLKIPCIPLCSALVWFCPTQLSHTHSNCCNCWGIYCRRDASRYDIRPAVPVGFETNYYEVRVVFENTVLQKGLSIVLGIPMVPKSSNSDLYRDMSLHQPNEDATVAFLNNLSQDYAAIATKNSHYGELTAITPHQINRIEFCWKGFFYHQGRPSLLFDFSLLRVRHLKSSQLLSGFCLVAGGPASFLFSG